MPLIRTDSGCKVGWETYDNEAEAKARGERARAEARDMARRGYDFGYQCPGEVTRGRTWREVSPEGRVNYDAGFDWLDEWTVVIP